MMRYSGSRRLPAAVLALAACLPAAAQEPGSAPAQANNPLANFAALNLQDYYIGRLTQTDDDANQFWLRYARPLKLGETNWLH